MNRGDLVLIIKNKSAVTHYYSNLFSHIRLRGKGVVSESISVSLWDGI